MMSVPKILDVYFSCQTCLFQEQNTSNDWLLSILMYQEHSISYGTVAKLSKQKKINTFYLINMIRTWNFVLYLIYIAVVCLVFVQLQVITHFQLCGHKNALVLFLKYKNETICVGQCQSVLELFTTSIGIKASKFVVDQEQCTMKTFLGFSDAVELTNRLFTSLPMQFAHFSSNKKYSCETSV